MASGNAHLRRNSSMDLNIRLGDHVRSVGATGKKENAIYIGMQLSLADAEALLRPLPQRAQATLVSNLNKEDLGPVFLAALATLFAHCEARLTPCSLYPRISARCLDGARRRRRQTCLNNIRVGGVGLQPSQRGL